MNRHPIPTVLMVVIGFFMLLPGVCAAWFMLFGGLDPEDPTILGIWAISLLIAAGGGFLLYKALRTPLPPTP